MNGYTVPDHIDSTFYGVVLRLQAKCKEDEYVGDINGVPAILKKSKARLIIDEILKRAK